MGLAALKETVETVSPASRNLPDISDVSAVFSYVSDSGELMTKPGSHHSTSGYQIVAIEEGNLERARELASARRTRHCFNEEAIIKHLEQTGQPFDILEVVPEGLCHSQNGEPSYAEKANERAGDQSFMSHYLLIPRAAL